MTNRRVVPGLILAVALLAAAVGLAPPARATAAQPAAPTAYALTATVNGTGGQGLFVRTGPYASGPVLATLGDGTAVTISCYAHGDTIAGYFYTSDLWQHITSPVDGWVTDTYVFTGVNGIPPGEPPCSGGTAAPPPKPWVATCRSRYVESITWTDGARGSGLTYRIRPTTLARRVAGINLWAVSDIVLGELLRGCLPQQARGRFDAAGGTIASFRAQIRCHFIAARNKATYNIDSASSTTNWLQALRRSCQ